jgi:autotransporter-associated beta strand protein
VFDTSTGYTLNNDLTAGLTFNAITFNAGAGAYTISGNSFILGGTLTNNSTNTQTLSTAIALSSTQTFDVITSGNTVLSGVVSGSGGITKTSAGTLTLQNGSNTYTGTTTISAGTLKAGATGAFSTSSSVSLANVAGATLDTTGFNTTVKSLSGGGTTGGAVVLGGNTLTNNNTVAQNYAGSISGSSGGGYVLGSGNQTLSGVLSGAISITNAGTGTLTLSNSASSFSGGINIKSGTVTNGAYSGTPYGAGSLNIGDASNSNTTLAATLLMQLNGTFSNAINVAGSGINTLQFKDITSGTTLSGPVTLTNSNLIVLNSEGAASTTAFGTFSGNVTGTGNLIITHNGTLIGITTNFTGTSLNNTGTIVSNGTGIGNVNISAAIGSNVTSVTQNSTAQLNLSGVNLYSGGTFVTSGTITTSGSGTFGTGNVTVSLGAALTAGNAASFGDASTLFFNKNSTAASISIFSGTDTIGDVYDTVSGTYIAAGTYTAGQLNSFFGGNGVFTGSGSLNVLALSIPEPSTYAAIFGTLVLGGAFWRRRRSVVKAN